MKRLLSAILAIAMIAALAPVAMADSPVAIDKMRLTGFTGSLRAISPTSSNGRKSIVNNVGWDGIVKTDHVIDTLALGHTVYICSSVGTGTLYNGTPDAPAADHYLYVPAGDLKASGAAKAQDGFVGWDYIESIQFEYAHITGNGTDNARWLIGATLKKYADLSPEQQAAVAAGTAKVGGKIDVTYNGDVYGTGFAFNTSNHTITWNLSELPVDSTDYQYYKTSGGTNINGLRVYTEYPTSTYEFRKAGSAAGSVNAAASGIISSVDLGGVFYQQINAYGQTKFLTKAYEYGEPTADGAVPVQLKEYVPAGNLIETGAAAFSADSNIQDYVKAIVIKYLKAGGSGAPRFWLEYTLKSEDELSSAAKAALISGEVTFTGTMTLSYAGESAVSGHNISFGSNGFDIDFTNDATKLTIPKLDIAVTEGYRIEGVYTKSGAYEFRKASTTVGAVNAAAGGLLTTKGLDLGGEAFQLVYAKNSNADLAALTVTDGTIPAEAELYVPAGELIGSEYLEFSSDSNAADYIKSVTIKLMKSGGNGAPRYWLHYQFKDEADLTPEQLSYLKTNGALTGSMTVTYGGATGFANGSITVDFTKEGTPKVNAPTTRTMDPLSIKGTYGNGWRTYDGTKMGTAIATNMETELGKEYYLLMAINSANTNLNSKTYDDVKNYAPAGNLLGTEYLTLSDGFVGAEYIDSVSLDYLASNDAGNMRWYLKVGLKAADDASLTTTQKNALVNGVALTGTMTFKHTDAAYGFYNESEGYTFDLKLGASETYGLTLKGDTPAVPAVDHHVIRPYINSSTTYRFLPITILNTTNAGFSNTAANKVSRVNPGEAVYQFVEAKDQSNFTGYAAPQASGEAPEEVKPWLPEAPLTVANGGLVFSGNAGDYVKSVDFKYYRNGTGATSTPRLWAEITFKSADELSATAKAALGTDGIKLTGTMSMNINSKYSAPVVFDFDHAQAALTVNALNTRSVDALALKELYTASGAGWRTIVNGAMSTAIGKNIGASTGDTYYTLMAVNGGNAKLNTVDAAAVAAYAPVGNLLDSGNVSFSNGFVGKEYIDSVTVEFLESATAGQWRWYLGIGLKAHDDPSLTPDQQAALADGVALTGTITLKHDDETYGFCNADLGYTIDVELGASKEFGLTAMHVDPFRVVGIGSNGYTYCQYNNLMATWTPTGEAPASGAKGPGTVSWGDTIYFQAQSFDNKYPVTDGNYVSEFEIVSCDFLDYVALDNYGNPDISFIRSALRSAPDVQRYYLGIRFNENRTDDVTINGTLVLKKTGEKGFATAGNIISIPVEIDVTGADMPYTETIERTEENQKVAKFSEIGYGTKKRVQALVEDEDDRSIVRYPNALGQANTSYTYADWGETVYFMLEDAAGNRVIDGDYVSGIKIDPNWLNQGKLVEKMEFVMRRYDSKRDGEGYDYCYFLAITFVDREYSYRQNVTGEITLKGSGKHGIADTHREYDGNKWIDVENKDNEIMLLLDVWVGPPDSTVRPDYTERHFFADRKINQYDTRYNFEDPAYDPVTKTGDNYDVGTDEEDTIYLWGTQGDCYFTVDTRNQGRMSLSNNTDYDEHFGSIYGEDAELQFINGNGATFKKNGIMTISVPDDSYFIYQIKNGAVQEIPELTFDKQECAYQFRTRHLGRYMISSAELDLDKQYYFVNGYYDPNVGLAEEGE